MLQFWHSFTSYKIATVEIDCFAKRSLVGGIALIVMVFASQIESGIMTKPSRIT